jgi:hypothetical protein
MFSLEILKPMGKRRNERAIRRPHFSTSFVAFPKIFLVDSGRRAFGWINHQIKNWPCDGNGRDYKVNELQRPMILFLKYPLPRNPRQYKRNEQCEVSHDRPLTVVEFDRRKA